MNNILVIAPILFQLFAGTVLLFFWTKIQLQKVLSILFSIISLGLGIWLFLLTWTEGIQFTYAGNWDAPFGISFVSDLLSATLVLIASISGLAVSLFSVGTMREERLKFGFFPIMHFLIMGLSGAFLAGDMFNLYVWFEVVIIASFVLLTLGSTKSQLEGAIKYVSLNLLASSLFLIGIGFVYGLTGSLNFADVAVKLSAISNRGLINVTAGIFLVSFGIKSAIFPMYFWLPASYHTPPPAVSAIFGGLLTKLGVYALLRTFTLMFGGDEFLGIMLSIIAALTILSGGLGALLQKNLSKAFGYLIICHIGFMIAGLGMFTEVAILGTVFYLFHDIIVKTNLFMVAGLVLKINGTQDITKLGGMYKSYPLISILLSIPLFSLVGIPPLSGFWPKIFLIQGGLASEEYFLIAFIVLGSFLTLWVVAKIWAEVFWKNAENLPVKASGLYFNQLSKTNQMLVIIPIIFLSIVSLYIGFAAENIYVLSEKIAADLMNPQKYIETILGIKTVLP
jgi:multicomponent Na+:H+ antiporter subunit D